jgi:hypothetical protein
MKIVLLVAPLALVLGACAVPKTNLAGQGMCTSSISASERTGNQPFRPGGCRGSWGASDGIASRNQQNLGRGAVSEPVT